MFVGLNYLDNIPEPFRKPQGPVQFRQHSPPQHLRASRNPRVVGQTRSARLHAAKSAAKLHKHKSIANAAADRINQPSSTPGTGSKHRRARMRPLTATKPLQRCNTALVPQLATHPQPPGAYVVEPSFVVPLPRSSHKRFFLTRCMRDARGSSELRRLNTHALKRIGERPKRRLSTKKPIVGSYKRGGSAKLNSNLGERERREKESRGREERQRQAEREARKRERREREAAQSDPIARLQFYKEKWDELRSDACEVGPLHIYDIPWPSFENVRCVEDISHITEEHVMAYVCHLHEHIHGLGVEQIKTVCSEIRCWHPDQFDWNVLKRVSKATATQ